MTEETKKKSRFKIAKIFKKKNIEKNQKDETQKSNKKLFGKRIRRFFGFFRGIKKNKLEEEKILVTEEEVEEPSIVELIRKRIEEKEAKKAKKKAKRKKRIKTIRRVALRSCHYMGAGVANMSPAIMYHSPSMMRYNSVENSYVEGKQIPYWTAGMVLAVW